MARKRRPSIGLIILFIILLALFFFAGAIVDLISQWTGQGVFTYSYTQGSEAIVSIKYTMPQSLAEAMAFKPPQGWTANMNGSILTLTGSTLNPGDSLSLDYRLKEYIPGGTNAITVTSTTATGTETTNQINLYIADAFLLNLAEILYQNNIWILVLAILVLVAIIALFIKGEKVPDQKANQAQTPQ